MSEFRKTVAGFRAAMREEGARSVCPGLAKMLERESRRKAHRLRWAAVAAGLTLMLGAIPFYHDQQKKRAEERERSEMRLLEQVNQGLSRSVSPAMAPLLGVGQGN